MLVAEAIAAKQDSKPGAHHMIQQDNHMNVDQTTNPDDVARLNQAVAGHFHTDQGQDGVNVPVDGQDGDDQPMDPPADDGTPVEIVAESEDEFDNEAYDDDGMPLVDEKGETLIPFDPDATYTEGEAMYIATFAGTYREVRGKLQAARVGRDQRFVKSDSKKGKGKGKRQTFQKKKPFFKPGQGPKKPDKSVRIPFKDKAGGKTTRGTVSDLLKRTKCYKCGKLGHMARNCKSKTTSQDGPKSSFFIFTGLSLIHI